MQRLFGLVRSLKEYLVFSFLVLVSLVLLSANDNPQLREVRAYTVGFIGLMQRAFSVIPNVFELQRENEILRQLNVNLADEVSRLREARLENLRLREMLGLRESSPFPILAADVVAKSSHMLRNTITLNVGEADGVKTDMPIISESGLVGKVTATSSRFSVGQLMFNKDFRASAKVERSRVDGIIAWDGGEYVRLKNVPKKQDVLKGDIVVTSEYSNVFPPRIRIGRVVNVEEKPASLFKDIEIEPSVDFARLEQAFIVLLTPDTSRANVQKNFPEEK
ncbi:MAG: rod shape-determining protein MreC [Ignavibacteriales bacterium]|nr:rod shape-determining protein MreC [Ignavibacteriales bacterium]